MKMKQLSEEIIEALNKDQTIDIITTGAKTGLARKIEIWFTKVGDRIIICGTPDAGGGGGFPVKRDWLANLRANPDFTFCLKESINVQLPAKAIIIEDRSDRREIMSSPETKWYRDQGNSIDALVEHSPIVEVFIK